MCDISFRFRRPASGDGDDGLSTVPCVHLKLRSALCIAYVQWKVGETVVFRPQLTSVPVQHEAAVCRRLGVSRRQ